MKTFKIFNNLKVSGSLFIKEGVASNIERDKDGSITDWDFSLRKEIDCRENAICTTGINFVLQRDWGIPMAIALGSGFVTGSNLPSATNVKLNAELQNARFGVRGARLTRVSNGVITLSALWSKTQIIATGITEFGLFCNEAGSGVIGTDTGFLIARKAYSYSKSDPNADVEIVWVITFLYN